MHQLSDEEIETLAAMADLLGRRLRSDRDGTVGAPSLLDTANRLTDPKLRAACERIMAHPDTIPEMKDTARAMLRLVEMEERRRANQAAKRAAAASRGLDL